MEMFAKLGQWVHSFIRIFYRLKQNIFVTWSTKCFCVVSRPHYLCIFLRGFLYFDGWLPVPFALGGRCILIFELWLNREMMHHEWQLLRNYGIIEEVGYWLERSFLRKGAKVTQTYPLFPSSFRGADSGSRKRSKRGGDYRQKMNSVGNIVTRGFPHAR